MESDWPPFLSKLLQLTAQRTQGRVAIHARCSILIKPLNSLLANQRVIKVTGTNGKGSVCAMLEACLQAEGLKVGLFTSPHLFHVTERFRVVGIDASSWGPPCDRVFVPVSIDSLATYNVRDLGIKNASAELETG